MSHRPVRERRLIGKDSNDRLLFPPLNKYFEAASRCAEWMLHFLPNRWPQRNVASRRNRPRSLTAVDTNQTVPLGKRLDRKSQPVRMRLPQFGKQIDWRTKEMNRNDDSSKKDCAEHKHIFGPTNPSNTAQPSA